MNFNLKSTAIYQALKRKEFPLFRFAGFLKNLFLFLFILFLVLFLASFADLIPQRNVMKLALSFFALFLIFFNLNLFIEKKIKRPEISAKLSDAFDNLENYNLAEFLSIESAKLIDDASKFCLKKKLSLNSTAIFYFLIKANKDISIIALRLGIDVKKLEIDLKNYLEKIPKESVKDTEDFQNTIIEAGKISLERGYNSIGEKEIFVALSKHNEFFKNILVEYGLKDADLENLAIWLESVKKSIKRQKEFWSYENLLRQGSMGKDWTSGYTINLDQFSIDWRRVVSKWPYKEIMCHKKEVEQVEALLAKSNLSNVLIVGEPGSARKSIIEALAQKCYLGASLPELNNKRVVELDLVTMLSAINDFENLESALDQVFSEALRAGNVVLFINNLQNFVGHDPRSTPQKAGVADISGILTKYLAIPKFQFVAITDYEGLHKNIEQNSSFLEFFQKVEVSEVTEIETIKILQNLATELEYKYKIIILYPAIREIVNLTNRYMPSQPFPEKAINILNELAVYLRSKKEKVAFPHHVAEIVSDKTGIPVGKMDVKEKEVLLNLENLIHQRIINQKEAVKEISTAMRRARSGISSKKRPMGTFLFMGPTGVGKTETSKALAQIYFGSEDKMIRLDMSEFQSISDIPRLVGAVSPVEMQGLLTTPVRESPFSLVLLDEIEKAHPNILNLFLQVFDEGHITDGQGRKVMFTNTIIIATSNAAADMIFKEVESGKPIDKQKLINSLVEKGTFKPEFINRFDAVVVFHPLTKDNLMQIAQLMLAGLQKSLKEKEIDFEITEDLKEKIVELSYKPEFGAREMRRVIQDKAENSVAEALLSDKIQKGDKIQLNPETFEVIINPVE